MSTSTKVLIVGLDGATFTLIKPWVAQGKLPTMARLMGEGAHRVLRSTYPPNTAPAWTTFLTGKNQGKHGIFNFTELADNAYWWRATNALSRRAPALWRYTDAANLRAGFFFVPMTSPPEPLNGMMITGLGTPNVRAECTYPAGLRDELIEKFGETNIMEGGTANRTPLEFSRHLRESVGSQAEIITYLQGKEEFDLVVAVFGQSDRAEHFFWKQYDAAYPGHDPTAPDELKNALLLTYQQLDAAIARLMSACPNATVFIMSDHGMGAYHREFYVNNWLSKIGMLKYREKQSGGLRVQVTRLLGSLNRLGRKYLPPQVQSRLSFLLGARRLSKLRAIEHNAITAELDWAQTKGYCMGAWGGLYLNIKGRDAAGCVAPADAPAVVAEIAEKLRQVIDPQTGEPAIGKVHLRADLYTGPYAEKGPELLIECRDPACGVRFDLLGDHDVVFTNPDVRKGQGLEITGNHRMEGIFIACGAPIAARGELSQAQIADIAPTVLYALGLAVPDDMDGKVMTDLFAAEHITTAPPAYTAALVADAEFNTAMDYSAEEMAEVEERLRGLGYIE